MLICLCRCCDAFTSSKAFGAGTFVLGLHENERNFKVVQKENSVIFLKKTKNMTVLTLMIPSL